MPSNPHSALGEESWVDEGMAALAQDFALFALQRFRFKSSLNISRSVKPVSSNIAENRSHR